nr:NHLP leader peptide family RiPP precursor [Schwartzia sp. (in: firmicutes)]
MADKKQNLVKYGEVVAKCWEDEAYKKRFLEDPESVLSEAGFVVDEGVTYKVIEQPKMVKYLVLPHEDTRDAVQTIAKGFLNAVEKKDLVIPEGAEVRIIQNTDDMRYMILPASPKSLTAAELKMVAGGDSVELQTNVVQTAEVATTAVEAQTATTTTTYLAEAEVGVVAVAVAVLV